VKAIMHDVRDPVNRFSILDRGAAEFHYDHGQALEDSAADLRRYSQMKKIEPRINANEREWK